MKTLRAINSAVVDLFHLLLSPLQEGEHKATASDVPLWVRAAVGWAFIGLFLAAFIFWR